MVFLLKLKKQLQDYMICPVFELINNLLLFSKIKMIFEVLILKVAFFLLSFIVFL